MKKLFSILFVSLCAFVSNSSSASVYLLGEYGLGKVGAKTSSVINGLSGSSWAAGIGYKFPAMIAVEGAYHQASYDGDNYLVDSVYVDSSSMELEMITLGGRLFVGFFSLSAGYAYLTEEISLRSSEVDTSTGERTRNSYYIGGGLNFGLLPLVDLYADLRFVNVHTKAEVKVWSALLGTRINF